MTHNTEVGTTGSKTRRTLWRDRNFLLLWAGQSVGMIGPQISLIALPLLALDTLHASTFQVSLLTFFGWLPFLVFSLPAGALVDRWDQRRTMIGCDLARMLLMLSVPLLGLADWLQLWYLYTVVCVVGILTVLFTVAYRGQLPRMLDADQLVEGNAKFGMSESFAELIGPSLGGALAGLVGALRATFGGMATFWVSAVTLGLIRVSKTERPAEAEASQEPFRIVIRRGLRHVFGDILLRRLLICAAIYNFFVVAISAISIVYLKGDVRAPVPTIGVVLTVGAVGGLVAGLFAPRISSRLGSARTIWLSLLVLGPLYLLMPLAAPGWRVALYAAGLFAASFGGVLFNVGAITYRQTATPSELLGRVNATYLWVTYGMLPLGSLFGGAFGTWVGLRATVLICAFGAWSGSLFLVFSPLRRMRDLPLRAAARDALIAPASSGS